ncbi:30S ribosomal protein S16 [Schnuerera sp. xch1]|uniref:30S ribosomal protein S16 n=1 Tax=Schnuerera sp. xch1 TaxID=2874283 RepID=UPI001CC13188|nr:30S ribosomal protein S16 [Schnuerera sp. xch1]MBZ2173898.1 30S ribosomal protein S16 [Schnuerera sp. xch1]
MAVKIRLKRMGAKKNPFYRIIVADSRSPRNGRFIEEIGYYNPLTNPKTVKIDDEKATNWLNNGAKPTDTVDRLFRENGIYEKDSEVDSNTGE